MPIEARLAESARDFEELRRLFLEYEADLPPELRHGPVPSVAALRRDFAEPNAAFLATIEGENVGCVAMTPRDGTTAVIRHLFVAPHGRGRGAARILVERVIERARATGYRRVALDTHKGQLQPAYLLYRGLGFEECAPHGEVDYESPTFMELWL